MISSCSVAVHCMTLHNVVSQHVTWHNTNDMYSVLFRHDFRAYNMLYHAMLHFIMPMIHMSIIPYCVALYCIIPWYNIAQGGISYSNIFRFRTQHNILSYYVKLLLHSTIWGCTPKSHSKRVFKNPPRFLKTLFFKKP